MDYGQASLELHKTFKGKLSVESTVPVTNKEELAVAYTPGVAAVSRAVADGTVAAADVIASKHTVAVITDGSAVLGLGDIGVDAALPVMEGKAVLFKEFAGINAFPIGINTQDVDEFVETVERIAPTFGGINLEDISAPRCFEIEERLRASLPIPVFHDDQHGTAIVVLAGLLNALQVVGKRMEDVKIVVSGAGAAGVAIMKLLHDAGAVCQVAADRGGIIVRGREELTPVKEKLLEITNPDSVAGSLADALVGADVFIGVSKGGIVTREHISAMAKGAIVFAMANPDPEIMPQEALAGGAAVIATGRSDFPNQLNNVLAFPGVFKGAFTAGVKDITDGMKLAAGKGLAGLVKTPTADTIIPSPFDAGVADAVAQAVIDAAYLGHRPGST